MSEPVPGRSSNLTTDNPDARRDIRWPRLFAAFFWNFGFLSLGWLLSEYVWHVWAFGFGGWSFYQVLTGLGKALGFGFFCALFIAFSTWLAQEIFGRPKNDSSPRPGG